MSFDTIATVALVVLLTTLLITHRKHLHFQRFLGVFYVALYRTKAGLTIMDKLAKKYKTLWVKGAPFIIAIGFIGMAIVSFDLIRSIINVLFTSTSPTVGVVLPIEAKGVFYVPFIYWIISIFAILIVHEGMHGVMARALGMKVRSSGLMVLGIIAPLIPGAFVEPDEKQLRKAKTKDQLAVYAAGPFANIISAVVCIALLSFVFNPITDGFYGNNVVVTDMLGENSPAEIAGISPGETINQIDGRQIKNTNDFSAAIRAHTPGETISVVTGGTVYDVTLQENPDSGSVWFGTFVEQPLVNTSWWAATLIWFRDLFWWLFLLNLGVGLFNLVPLGPIDGGRMLLAALQTVTKEHRATRIWKTVSVCLLCVLVTNIVVAFV